MKKKTKVNNGIPLTEPQKMYLCSCMDNAHISVLTNLGKSVIKKFIGLSKTINNYNFLERAEMDRQVAITIIQKSLAELQPFMVPAMMFRCLGAFYHPVTKDILYLIRESNEFEIGIELPVYYLVNSSDMSYNSVITIEEVLIDMGIYTLDGFLDYLRNTTFTDIDWDEREVVAVGGVFTQI